MNSHSCIKCKETYLDDEVDDYYCNACKIVKDSIANELDAKFNTRNQVPSGALAAYDQARGNSKFPSAAALGIKL